ncbi:hypothetical protein FOZ60_001484 [Perkinsus olseni]|uniref:RING-type domain-containing protein n=1 Tax=Perkinsus olseni TaxID=32597 RepID=A0A7J6P1I6_PEROL|nr:hypothetical protein FOZ60_001484 [Perkinsus olseni]
MTTSIRATHGPSSSAPPGPGPGRRFWGLPLPGRSGGAAAPAQEILRRFLVELDAFIPEEKARMGEGCAAIYRLEEIRDHREYVNEEETIMLCVEGSGFDLHQLRSTVKGEAAYRTLCEETQTRFIEMQQGLSSRIQDLEAEKIVLLERVEELEDALRRSVQKKDDVEEPLRNGFVTTRRTPPIEQRAFHPPPRRKKGAKKPPGVSSNNRRASYGGVIEYRGPSQSGGAKVVSVVAAFEYPDPQHDPERCGLSTPGWICDPDRYLSRDEINFLDQELRKGFAVDSECGPYQLAVAISRNTWPVGGVERFARSIHNAWGVGHAPCDSGVVMALDIGNREMFISTGKAANDRMSTSSASVIIDRMRPFMREYKYAEGIFEGVKLIRQVVDTGEQLSGITFPLILFFTLFFGIWGCVIFFFIKACLQNRRTSAVRRQLGRMEKERAEALQGHFRQTSCPICLEDFELHPSSDKKNDESAEQQAPLTGQECELLRCGHKFHKACLQEWQEQGIHRARDGLRCPVCRKDVNKDEDSDDEHGGGGPNGGGKRVPSSSSSTGLGGGMTYVGPFYPGYEYGPLWDFQMMRLRHQYPGIVTDGFVQQYSWTSLGTGASSCPMPSQDRSINPPPPPSSHQGGGGSGFGGSNFGGGGASGGGAGGSW